MPDEQPIRRVYITDESAEQREHRHHEDELRLSVLVRSVVSESVTEALKDKLPTEEERQGMRLAMQREARRETRHQALVEKSLAGLLWAAIAGLGIVVFDYLKSHGWKP